MDDDWRTQRAEPSAVGVRRTRRTRQQRLREARFRRRRRTAAAIAVGLVIALAVFLGSRLWHSQFGDSAGDYAGDGVTDIVVQVRDGDSTTAIGDMLTERKVVRTTEAFVAAAAGNPAISAIQPGFYQLRTKISAAAAVERLADPANRVGKLVVPEGRQLDDVRDVRTNALTDGIFTLISEATCVDLDNTRRCVPAADLRAVAGSAPAAALRVPAWASAPVAALGADHRRLEGLIAPGTWNVDPLAAPGDILAALIGGSTSRYEGGGLLATAEAVALSPYEILTVASLVQREATTQDFAKVARVIDNRLAERRTLEFDSTVNYPLDRIEVATTDGDRSEATPWNTYVRPGLPATPICSPGGPALAAAERPEPGDWLYFVTVDLQGTTLFTRDYPQHLANIEVAKRNGVLDSAR